MRIEVQPEKRILAAVMVALIVTASASAAMSRDRPAEMTMDQFLDRVMMVESGGRDDLRNPLSTAVGPFQLLEGLVLEVAKRHFAEETQHLSVREILALRTDRAFARRAAAAFVQDNANHLARAGLQTTFQNLRLAYFAGPSGAVRILRADPTEKVAALLSPAAIRANPFLKTMTAADLIARSAREISVDRSATDGIDALPDAPAEEASPRVKVRCNLQRASCQKWLALRKASHGRKEARNTKAETKNRAVR